MLGVVLWLVGAYLLARAAYGVYRIVEELFLLKELNLKERYGRASWAFITGSTDGIGLEFAIQLAKRGFNIVMMGRNRVKMNEKEVEIKKANPNVQILKLEIDMKDTQEVSKVQGVLDILENVDVSVVVNNVGVGTEDTPPLDMSMQASLDMIVVNTLPQTLFTHLFLPRLRQRESRSAIIDVSSVTSVMPLPGKEIYGGTKYYNRSYNVANSILPENKNIDFLVVKPGFVTTKLIGYRQKDLITATTEGCVNGALKALGHKPETYGAPRHVLFGSFLELLSFVLPMQSLLKYKDQIYGIIGYKAFKQAKLAK